MIAKKIELQNLRLDTRYNNLKKLADIEFKKIQKFIDKAKNGENNKGIDISEKTERKYIDAFTMAYKSLKKKRLSQLTKKDLTELKQGLKSGQIKSRFKQSYSLSSQREMELILIRFLEFINPDKYSGYRKWFVVRVPRKSVERLKEEEIIKLFRACRTNQERYLIAVLFDSGARASEFFNIRFEDIQDPTPDFPYYKIDLKEEYSKTNGRNIGCYWKYSTEAIRDYVNELENTNSQAQVYPKTYDAVRLFLTRLGKRVLGKRLHFHIFRKSSASYYAHKLMGRQQLCYRYGWMYSSDVVDVYINREQGEKDVKENMVKTSQGELEEENQEIKTRIGIIENTIKGLPVELIEALSKTTNKKMILINEKKGIYSEKNPFNLKKISNEQFEKNKGPKIILELRE